MEKNDEKSLALSYECAFCDTVLLKYDSYSEKDHEKSSVHYICIQHCDGGDCHQMHMIKHESARNYILSIAISFTVSIT